VVLRKVFSSTSSPFPSSFLEAAYASLIDFRPLAIEICDCFVFRRNGNFPFYEMTSGLVVSDRFPSFRRDSLSRVASWNNEDLLFFPRSGLDSSSFFPHVSAMYAVALF